MTEVNRYRDGELSSTKLMQDAMEEAHAVPPGEGKSLEWHKDHESMDHARARLRDEPEEVFKIATAFVLGIAVKDIAKTVIKDLARVAGDTAYYAEKIADGAKYASGVASAAAMPELLLAVGCAAAVAEVGYAAHQAHELRHLSDVDGLDVAVTKMLDLDPGFRGKELAKFPSIAASKTVSFFVQDDGAPTAFGQKHLPELQAAADEGARSALALLGGGTLSLAERPDLQKRIQDDVAFSKGFSNVFFIASWPDHEGKLAELQTRMDIRAYINAIAVPVKG